MTAGHDKETVGSINASPTRRGHRWICGKDRRSSMAGCYRARFGPPHPPRCTSLAFSLRPARPIGRVSGRRVRPSSDSHLYGGGFGAGGRGCDAQEAADTESSCVETNRTRSSVRALVATNSELMIGDASLSRPRRGYRPSVRLGRSWIEHPLPPVNSATCNHPVETVSRRPSDLLSV